MFVSSNKHNQDRKREREKERRGEGERKSKQTVYEQVDFNDATQTLQRGGFKFFVIFSVLDSVKIGPS